MEIIPLHVPHTSALSATGCVDLIKSRLADSTGSTVFVVLRVPLACPGLPWGWLRSFLIGISGLGSRSQRDLVAVIIGIREFGHWQVKEAGTWRFIAVFQASSDQKRR
jgi:hypothetical protein